MKPRCAIQARFFDGQLGGERAEFWEDCTPRISGREYNSLLESACYLRGELTCLSCHSLHQGDPHGQLTAEMRGNQACLQCHAEYREKLMEHTHHPANSSGSLCYNCHMPNTSYGLLSFTRSHRIDSPSAAQARPDRPNACVLCHLDQTRSWAASHLSDWYGQTLPPADDEDDVAAGAVHALRGDCCQRVLIAWHARWEPARTASGSAWLTPLVTQLLNDPYAAVRYQAGLTLRTLPGFENFTYDYVAPESVRACGNSKRSIRGIASHRRWPIAAIPVFFWTQTAKCCVPARSNCWNAAIIGRCDASIERQWTVANARRPAFARSTPVAHRADLPYRPAGFTWGQAACGPALRGFLPLRAPMSQRRPGAQCVSATETGGRNNRPD